MYRVFILLQLLLLLSGQIQAQSKSAKNGSTSKIDSLSKRFDAAKNDATKINVLVNAPKRIDEYYENPTAILNLYNKALTIARRIGDRKSMIALLVEIAYFEMNVRMDEPKAFNLYTQALEYAEAERDYAACAKVSFALAAISEHQNVKSELYDYLLKAIAYNEKSPVLYMRPYRWASATYLANQQIDDALTISQQAVSYVDRRSAPAEFKALAYGYYYSVLKKVPGRKQEADTYKKKIISLLSKIKVVSSTTILDGIAEICYDLEQYELAIFFANQLFDKTDSDSQLNTSKITVFEILSASYERLGQHQKSLDYYKKYANAYLNALKNVTSLESGRKVIRAEGERNLILKQKELEKEKFYRNLSVAIAAFIMVLGGVIFLFYQREQKQKRALTQLNATKDKLVAILSHDLYSPITNLQNNVSLTDWGGLSQPEFTREVGQLGNQLAHVRNLLDNTLTWILSQMNGLLPVPKLLDIYELVENEILAQQITSTAKQITITNQIPEGVRLRADHNHLTVIVRNLLQNALKFTQPGGKVIISYTEETSQHQIRVRDTGVGMAPERLATLFALNQPSARGTANERGTGLGLVLVNELVTANGGQIDVESEQGKGTIFTLTFGR